MNIKTELKNELELLNKNELEDILIDIYMKFKSNPYQKEFIKNRIIKKINWYK